MPTQNPRADSLTPAPGDVAAVKKLLGGADPKAPPLGKSGDTLWIPVEGAELRVIHVKPARRAARPIVFVPGWGTTTESFEDYFAAVHGRAELYYVETREKSSSRIIDRRTPMSPEQSSRDVARVLESLGFAGRRDFLLAGTCWGSTLLLVGMIGGWIKAPTTLLGDPAHTLWFPKWLLRYVSPLLPLASLHLLRPILARRLLGDVQEPTMKRRAMSFVYSADFWKWKRSAEAAQDLELFGSLGDVRQEVFILNGTRDKVHDPIDYPRMAAEMPGGRFLFMPADENRREMLFGTAALEFARVRAAEGLPKSLARFERRVR